MKSFKQVQDILREQMPMSNKCLSRFKKRNKCMDISLSIEGTLQRVKLFQLHVHCISGAQKY